MELQKRSHALVIGSGIAGMCAARALSGHFDRVTLVERDRLPDRPEHRPGVPQSHHVHVLLLRGLLELERLFPGIERDLNAAGASRMDLGYDVAHCTQWGWAPRARIDVAPIMVSRLLIENTVRARIRQVPNLELLVGTRVTGLSSERQGAALRVTGVTTSHPERSSIATDLVVDAAGRGSKALEWLEAAGVARPSEELVDAFAGYASRFYELAPNPARWWRGMVTDPVVPDLPRWALLMPIENGRSVLTLAGINRDYPPSDEPEFLAFLNSVLSPELGREIARARPLSEIHTHRALSNRARHFERWSQEVGGFVAMGDGAVAFNASHGQGMSMAALSANALGDVYARAERATPFALTKRFHEAQWKRLRPAWQLATGADLEWAGTQGVRPWTYRFTVPLSVSVMRAAHEDPDIKRQIGPVFQMVAEPSTLYRPGFLGRVLIAEVRRRLGRNPQLTPFEAAISSANPSPTAESLDLQG